MNNILPTINAEEEKERILTFLQQTLHKQHIQNAVIGLSGGIDSTTSLYLLREVVAPEHIFVVQLPYFPKPQQQTDALLTTLAIPESNRLIISIKPLVDAAEETLHVQQTDEEKIRLGNIMARSRMIVLFDLAKKHDALVCGTENRSEHLLGYYTRFGDEASDIEPIRHLYKTQVYQLAQSLGVPQAIIDQPPTAGLWSGQTDEGQFGFSYQEADQVLYLYFDRHQPLEAITKDFPNAEKIITFAKQNEYKHHVPYSLE